MGQVGSIKGVGQLMVGNVPNWTVLQYPSESFVLERRIRMLGVRRP